MKRVLGIVKPFRPEKRMRLGHETETGGSCLDALSDDLLITILSEIAASAKSPSNLVAVMLSCKRIMHLCMDPVVLRNASCQSFSIPAKHWCEGAHRFLSNCADAGNMEAAYMLGMIEFYCLGHYTRGTELLVRAAQASHAEALYSLAVIKFPGISDSMPRCLHNLAHPVSLCAKSARLGHSDAITEISYHFWNSCKMPLKPDWFDCLFVEEDKMDEDKNQLDGEVGSSILHEQLERQLHPTNLFLVEWWNLPDLNGKRESDGLEICLQLCGRRETRSNEFYRSRCNKSFCSQACQDAHWRAVHHVMCDVSFVDEDVHGDKWFGALNDNVIISILCKMAASVKSPSDLISMMCRKSMKRFSMDPIILKHLSQHAFSIPAKSWCDQAHQFLSQCADAGNMEASYMLGMIEFYCFGHYACGTELLLRAAEASHAEALYSLAVIRFRGSGDKSGPHDLEHPVELCAKSARLGHRDARAEIVYCYWDCPDFQLSDLADCVRDEEVHNSRLDMQLGMQSHVANLFLVEWWQLPAVKSKTESHSLEMCSRLCGRRETRSNEFIRCYCNEKFYCSHACRDAHWEAEPHGTCI